MKNNNIKEAEKGIYIFCISDSKVELKLNIDCEFPFFWINYKDLYMLVKEVSFIEFKGHISEDNMDLNWLKEKTRNHENILEKIIDDVNLLAVSFGTVVSQWEDCKKILEENYNILKNSVEKIKGKREWKLKIFADKDFIIKNVKTTDEEIKSLTEKIKNKSPGTAYMLKKKLDNIIKEKNQKQYIKIINDVETMVEDFIEDKVQNEKKQLKENTVENEMILNINYLVSQDNKKKFIEVLDGINDKFIKKGFNMRLIGPWPVYSFGPDIEIGG